MDITSVLKTITTANLNINITETFHEVEIEVIIDSFCKPTHQFMTAIINTIPERDKIFTFLLTYNDINDIELEDMEISNFLDTIDDVVAISGEIFNTKLKIQINKSIDKSYISIYSLPIFSAYMTTLKALDLLTILSTKAKLGPIIFELIDYDSNILVSSSLISFVGKSNFAHKDIIEDSSLIEAFKSVCNLQTNIKYTFNPDEFYIEKNISPEIDFIFNKLKIIYSLIYIFDMSNLTNDILSLNLSGYKCLAITLDLNTLNYSKLNVYYDIYKWLYTDGNINDKIGVTRNVLSLYIKDSKSIELDSSVFTAIQSNYGIYLRNNVEKYLEVKSKIIETSLSTNTQISQMVDSLSNNFIKNLGAIGTFIVTIVVMKSLDDKKFEDIFTLDMVIISSILVLISIIYLKYTFKEFEYNKTRIKNFYERLKLSYNDILVKKDIDTIFNKDKYFNEDIESANNKVKYYKKSWCFMLLIFQIGVIILGFLIKK